MPYGPCQVMLARDAHHGGILSCGLIPPSALIVLTVSVCDAYRIMLWDFDGATDTFEGESYPALWVT